MFSAIEILAVKELSGLERQVENVKTGYPQSVGRVDV